MGDNTINSHIQMPKSVLKRFEKNGRFYYYNVRKQIIGNNGHARTLYTEQDYYSHETEDFLRDNVETPFGKLLKFIDSIDFEKPVFTTSSDFDAQVKVFVYALISRSPTLLSEIARNSVFFQFLPNQRRHDVAAVVGLSLAQEQSYFRSYLTTFAYNKTPIPFVLPVCGIYSIKVLGYDHIILPVSPQIAVVLVPAEAQYHIISDELISLYSIEDEAAVYTFNRGACRTQIQQGDGFIVSPEKNVLVESVNDAKVNLEGLKK